jgi:hypothetical protein
MIIECLFVLEKVSKSEKMFNPLFYHIANQQGCVRVDLFDGQQFASYVWNYSHIPTPRLHNGKGSAA